MADSLLSMVFANLIGNAVKFGGPGVAITIRAEEENGFVCVSVEDTGQGIPNEAKVSGSSSAGRSSNAMAGGYGSRTGCRDTQRQGRRSGLR